MVLPRVALWTQLLPLWRTAGSLLPWGKQHALIVALGYSRRMWQHARRAPGDAGWDAGPEVSLTDGGGVPSEFRFDQMQAIITGDWRDEGGRLLENPEFLASPPLTLLDPGVPPVPGPDEGQGRAARPRMPAI